MRIYDVGRVEDLLLEIVKVRAGKILGPGGLGGARTCDRLK